MATPDTGIDANLNGAIPFDADSQWNIPVNNAPILWDSAAIMASISTNVGLHPDFGSGTYDGISIGIPYVVVPADQPLVPFINNLYTTESDPGPFPIPDDAPIQGEGATDYNDHHLIVLQLDANGNLAEEYDFFQISRNADGEWQGYSVEFNLQGGDDQLPMGYTSANAAGLPEFPGLITYDEVQQAIATGGANGYIPHALAFTLESWDIGSELYGAAEHATGGGGAAGFGMRFVLNANYVVDPNLPIEDIVILNTLKMYGMILVDNGANFFLSGVADPRWNNSDLALLQTAVTGSDFEIVDTTGLVAPPPVTIGSGADSLVLNVSENPYQGNAQFTVSVDGTQIGGVQTIEALNSSNETETFSFLGNWGTAQHIISINYVNPLTDANGSRVMTLQSVTYDGGTTAASAANLTATDTTTFKIGTIPTVGSGADTLVLHMAENGYEGDAQFTVSVNGVQVGGVLTTTMIANSNVNEDFDILGNWGSGRQTVTVTYLNPVTDAGGSSALFVWGMNYDGTEYSSNVSNLIGGGTGTFLVGTPTPIGSGADSLVLDITDGAYKGNVQFTVLVDGVQQGGVQTATLVGGAEAFTYLGNWGTAQHTVTVSFLNGLSDAGGGRELSVSGMSYDGTNYANNLFNLYGTGAATFLVGTAAPIGSGSDKLVLNLSENGYQGDAQFTVTVDGVQVGGVQTATIITGSEPFTVLGNWGTGLNQVVVTFLNGISNSGGSRNLYVTGMTYDGTTYANNVYNLYGGGAASFTVGTAAPVGSGSDTLVLHILDAAYKGDAQFTVSVNGVQVGGIETALLTASAENFTFLGNWGSARQTVTVTFINGLSDAGGSRNLYVAGMSYDGTNYGNNVANLYGGGVGTFLVGTAAPIGSGSDKLVINLAESNYGANAQFVVLMDGVQVGGVQTATLPNGAEAFTFEGNWGTARHTVTVDFLPGTTNAGELTVEGMTYDTTGYGNSWGNIYGSGLATFLVGTAQPIGSGADTLVVNLAESNYGTNAQFTILVDGVQVGGVETATLLNQAEAFTFLGNWGTARHTVTVNFLPGTTNAGELTVEGMTYDGTGYGNNWGNLYGSGVGTFLVGTAQPIGSGPDTLVVNLAETNYGANAQFVVLVDGVQVGGVETASMINSAEAFTFEGNWGNAQHSVAVDFLPGTTNAGELTVEGMTFDGTGYGNNWANIYGSGTATFSVGSNSIAVSSASLGTTSGLSFISATAAGQTLIGSASFGTEFQGTSAGLNGDTIAYFGGNDVIDLTDMSFSGVSGSFKGSATGGTLTVTNGSHTAAMALIDGSGFNHTAFGLVSDGHGGTAVVF